MHGFKMHIKNQYFIFVLTSIVALIFIRLTVSERDTTIPFSSLSSEMEYTDYLNLTNKLTLRGGYFRSSYNISHTVFLARQKMFVRLSISNIIVVINYLLQFEPRRWSRKACKYQCHSRSSYDSLHRVQRRY